jgi:hypothetical protein
MCNTLKPSVLNKQLFIKYEVAYQPEQLIIEYLQHRK